MKTATIEEHTIAALAAVILWAETPGNHGGNPHMMTHVKLAEKALNLISKEPTGRCAALACPRPTAYPKGSTFCRDHTPKEPGQCENPMCDDQGTYECPAGYLYCSHECQDKHGEHIAHG